MLKFKQDYLAIEVPEIERLEIRKHESTGRPLGGEVFIKTLENRLGLELKLKKAGRKKKEKP